MPKIKVAFDVGNSALKIAVWRGGALELQEVPLPEHLVEDDAVTMPHAFSGFLKNVRRELRLSAGPAALVLPTSRCLCRLVTLPKMTVEQLEINLPYEFNDFIQGDVSQYYCDYAVCRGAERDGGEEDGEEGGEITMMAAAVERQLIRGMGRMFSGAGFNLRSVLPQQMALIRLAAAQEKPECCFIDLGRQSTRVILVSGDRLQAERQVPVGCRAVARAAADALHIDVRLAETYLNAGREDVTGHDLCRAVYDQIAVEVLKVVNFYRYTYRQNQLQGVYLIGGGANIAPLRRAMTERIELPALSLADLLGADGADEALLPSCACAAGAAMQEEA